MGRSLVPNLTYRSSVHGRLILVISILSEDSVNYSLDILWVDRDTGESEPDKLLVTKHEVEQWTEVQY